MKKQTRKLQVEPVKEPPKKSRRSRSAPPKNPGENPGEKPAPPSVGAPPTEAPAPGAPRPQAHGGQLRTGGTNRGGPGRPRNEIRELASRGYEKALPILIKMATGRYKATGYTDKGEEYKRNCTPKEITAAATELGNRGVGKMLEIELPKTPVSFGVLVCPEDAEELIAAEELRVAEALQSRGAP